MYFALKFNVWLQWMDDRLTYQNLKKQYNQNTIPAQQANQLWKPRLNFENSLDTETILKYNPLSSSLMLMRNGCWVKAPLNQLDEAEIFHSNETELLMRTAHFLKFKCQFELYFFPFDHQMCFVKVTS